VPNCATLPSNLPFGQPGLVEEESGHFLGILAFFQEAVLAQALDAFQGLQIELLDSLQQFLVPKRGSLALMSRGQAAGVDRVISLIGEQKNVKCARCKVNAPISSLFIHKPVISFDMSPPF